MRLFRGLRYAFYYVKCASFGVAVGLTLVEIDRVWK